MRTTRLRGLLAVFGLLVGLAGASHATPTLAQQAMQPFRSDADLLEFLMEDGELAVGSGGYSMYPPPPSPPPPPPPPPPPGTAPAAPVAAAPPALGGVAAPDNPSITNTQIAGVDEGGIVKVVGDYLVILRRGRLFSVSTAGGDLRPVGEIDAYPPGVNASRDWYDEMLVSGDWVVVVGYSYGRGGTEINRFRIGADGQFSFVDSHHLRSADYYSAENYASRLVGDQLIFYTPLGFGYDDDPLDSLPALSRWNAGEDEPTWQRITTGRQVYVARPLREKGPHTVNTMHTVSMCNLTAPELNCSATVILGSDSRTFFVSQNAVYVWTDTEHAWNEQTDEQDLVPAFLYRLPFDGAAPQAVRVMGNPMNQFSFNPNASASRMDILVSADSGGDEMWRSEVSQGDMALLRLPMSRFGDGSGSARPEDYQDLPGSTYTSVVNANRFVGDWAFYAISTYQPGNYQSRTSELVAVPVRGGEPTLFNFEQGVERIEPLGSDALIVGGNTSVDFTTLILGGARPQVGSSFTVPQASQTESRSHAFFYRSDTADGSSGLMGLPIMTQAAREGGGWQQGADMLFLRRSDRALSDFGRLHATPTVPGRVDQCVASCVDWYGNARPIFLRGRVFALMGYDLVEGREGGDRIEEVRRVDYETRGGGKDD
ncbi:beta-propeller domain-containing protein [Brevundimonas aveniformis]|uniref:beta-propeller domain-containing protein n=1 Tax=Brevundimonas aveniformis TaxID=370977 RepID=UPI00040514C5|nr:beta-propeller domain-containing protein [Brevundimonas aveniformis]